MRAPDLSSTWWKWISLSTVVPMRRMGTLTSPKLIEPDQMARGMARTYPCADAGRRARMVSIGYTIMGEQAGPKQLADDAVRAEAVGFDFLAASDHHAPWL